MLSLTLAALGLWWVERRRRRRKIMREAVAVAAAAAVVVLTGFHDFLSSLWALGWTPLLPLGERVP